MNAKACATSDVVAAWNQIDWQKAESYVKKLQVLTKKFRQQEHKNLTRFLNSNAETINLCR